LLHDSLQRNLNDLPLRKLRLLRLQHAMCSDC